MNHRSLFALPLAFVAAIAFADAPPVRPHPGILDVIAAADTILVQRVGHDPIPECDSDVSDSLRFTNCYPVLEQGVTDRPDWRPDLAEILGSRTLPWNHDSCGYEPQAVVRFLDPESPSDLVVFTSHCDSSRVGLLMLRPGSPMERVELRDGGGQLLDLLAEALPDIPRDTNPFAYHGTVTREDQPYDQEPTPITRVEPTYPAMPRGAELVGPVILDVLVGEDGRVKDVRVIRGAPTLSEPAIAAARQWVWNPARSRGRAVAAWVDVTMEFNAGGKMPGNLPPFPWGGGQPSRASNPGTKPVDPWRR
jgi:TonB family protein